MKKNIFKKIAIVLCLFCANGLFAQNGNISSAKLLSTYWHYRYRLTHHFMVVGPNAGESLPADIRNIYSNTDWLHWGETPLQLGYYIGVLATEYHLLKQNNQLVDQTLTELYYALNAVKRLDETAEQYWSKPNSLDGFMNMDDVPANFITNHPQLNDGVTHTASATGNGSPGTVGVVVSSFSANAQNAPSQDMYYNLLMGLALTKKYVDIGTLTFLDKITNTSNSYDFNSFVVSQADRIVRYIKSSDVQVDAWKLRRPDGSLISIGNGGDAVAFSYGVAKAGEYFTGNDYQNALSIQNLLTWQQFQSDDCVRGNTSQVTLPLILAAIGNSWRNISNENTTKTGIRHQGDYGAGSCTSGLTWSDNHYGWDLFYGAINRLLNGGTFTDSPYLDLCNMKNILLSAPYDGPFYHSIPVEDKAPPGWVCSRRFYSEPPAQINGEGHMFDGNFNGLDYMLFHNLYFIFNEGKDYVTLGNIPVIFGQNPNPIYTTTVPFTYIDTYHYILVENSNITHVGTIPGTLVYGGAVIVGGSQGVELNNVWVEQGATLDVYNDTTCSVSSPFEFVFNQNQYHMPTAPDYLSQNATANTPNQLADYPTTEKFKASNFDSNVISITPNPNNGRFQVAIKKNDQAIGIKELKVFDMMGKEIWSTGASTTNITDVDISDYSQGIYYVRTVNALGEIEMTKLIKQ